MASNRRTSRAGLDIIKTYEGFRPRYQKLPDGRWIVGFGHVRKAREGVQVSKDEAETLLREYDLPAVERLVSDCVMAPLNQNEFDALVSLAFNLGDRTFASSGVVRALNGGNRLAAAEEFDTWRYARIGGKLQVVDALVRRRAAEKALFLKAPGEMSVASSRIVKPLQDSGERRGLPEPREIVVEPAQSAVGPGAGTRAGIEGNVLSEATEAVRRQMDERLAQVEADVSASSEDGDGPSPEEVTAAISELVERVEENKGVERSVWPPREDLPPPPNFIDTGDAAPPSSAMVIDDLETVEVRPSDIERALEVNDQVAIEDRALKRNGALPFVAASVLGFVLLAIGLMAAFGLFGGDPLDPGFYELYVPPVLMLLGGSLAATMVYFALKTLIGD